MRDEREGRGMKLELEKKPIKSRALSSFKSQSSSFSLISSFKFPPSSLLFLHPIFCMLHISSFIPHPFL